MFDFLEEFKQELKAKPKKGTLVNYSKHFNILKEFNKSASLTFSDIYQLIGGNYKSCGQNLRSRKVLSQPSGHFLRLADRNYKSLKNKVVQNKLLWVISEQTVAELV